MLQRVLTRERVPHAFLFHGPEGVGKETLARGLAELLLCAKPIETDVAADLAGSVGLERLRQGCGRCEDCRLVAAETHPDFHRVYRQLHREHPDPAVRKRSGMELTVDVVRHFIIDRVALTSNRGRAKVFVVRGADEMNVQAQNALLKTLEEPPGATFLILLAASVEHLLATTLSRCQVVRFDALPNAFVHAKLAELCPGLSPEVLHWYVAWGEGSLGRAMEGVEFDLFRHHGPLRDGLATPGRWDPAELVRLWTESAQELGERYAKADSEITDAEATRRGLTTMFRLTANEYAEVLRTTTVSPSQSEACADAIQRIALAIAQLDLNVNTQLCLETLASDLARRVVV